MDGTLDITKKLASVTPQSLMPDGLLLAAYPVKNNVMRAALIVPLQGFVARGLFDVTDWRAVGDQNGITLYALKKGEGCSFGKAPNHPGHRKLQLPIKTQGPLLPFGSTRIPAAALHWVPGERLDIDLRGVEL